MQYEKYIKYALITIGVIAGLFLLPVVLRLFLPFILAFAVASPCQKILNFLNKKLKIHRGISSAVVVTLLVALVSWIVFILCSQLFEQIKSFAEVIPDTIETVRANFYELSEKYREFYTSFSPRFREFFESFNFQFSEYLTSAVAPLTTSIFNIAKRFAVSLPDVVIFFFMFLLSTFFITKDYALIRRFFRENCPQKIQNFLHSFKTTAFSAFLTYVRAQLIMMSITFTIVSIALWIIGAEYPVVMGALIGLVDALPFFGTAIIIVPWAIFSFLNGNYFFAGGLLVTQVIAFVVRQLLEPKIVSSQIGLHPLITLVSIYIGLNLFGIGGLFIGPVSALFIVNAYVAAKSKNQQS